MRLEVVAWLLASWLWPVQLCWIELTGEVGLSTRYVPFLLYRERVPSFNPFCHIHMYVKGVQKISLLYVWQGKDKGKMSYINSAATFGNNERRWFFHRFVWDPWGFDCYAPFFASSWIQPDPDHSRNSAFLYLQRKEHMEQLCSVLDTIDISCVDKTGTVWLFYPFKGRAFSFSSLLILEWTYFRGATAFSVPQIGSWRWACW